MENGEFHEDKDSGIDEISIEIVTGMLPIFLSVEFGDSAG